MDELLDTMQSAMKVRELSPLTQEAYLRHVRKLGRYYERCPSELGPDEVECYLLHLTLLGRSASTRNQCAAALRFLYTEVLRRPRDASLLPQARTSKGLPTVLSGREVSAVLSAMPSALHTTLAMACYGAGLRVSEACRLRVADIDSKRMVLHVHSGKGRKDRQVKLSERLLRALRSYYKTRRPRGPYLFEGRTPGRPITVKAFQKALTAALRDSQVRKRVTAHVLRHSYATHMIEAGADLRSVQLQLGHASIRSTARYVHLTHARLDTLPSPLDMLGTKRGQRLG